MTMRNTLFVLFFMTVTTSGLFAQNDTEAIRQVVTSAYIEGIHNGGPVDDIRRGFHPGFNMLRLMDNELRPLSIEEWIASIEEYRKEAKPASPRAEGKFVNIDVTGNNAIVKLELFRNDKKIFTDYLVLYKFNEGWQIVSKTFYRH